MAQLTRYNGFLLTLSKLYFSFFVVQSSRGGRAMREKARQWRRKHRVILRRLALAVLLALAVYRVFFDDSFSTEVVRKTILTRVHGGDTVEISGVGRCRLLGIDTPEVWRFRNGEWQAIPDLPPRAYAASSWLRTFVNREVRAQTVGKDHYDRWLIHLILPGGIDAAAFIRGHNWEKRKR
jgi:endonuclease YncB( thermonuclease family)